MKKYIRLFLFLPLFPLQSRTELVAHWTLEEGSGTVAADSTANGLAGTIAGGASWDTSDLAPVPSGTKAALEMDGVDDQIEPPGGSRCPGPALFAA